MPPTLNILVRNLVTKALDAGVEASTGYIASTRNALPTTGPLTTCLGPVKSFYMDRRVQSVNLADLCRGHKVLHLIGVTFRSYCVHSVLHSA
jgi:hypothetical protein